MLVANACETPGGSIVEAFLALGATVLAADRLRTRLDALRAELRHHERLWVAEAELTAVSSWRALLSDGARDRALDAVIVPLPGGDAATLPAAGLLEGVVTRVVVVADRAALGARVDAWMAAGLQTTGCVIPLQTPRLLSRVIELADPARAPERGWVE